jgi:uncharacterized damage-inducible protein DinB
MPQSDVLEILLAHDQWATVQILNACAKLTEAQFHQRFEIGSGSLHDTLTHILAVVQTWTQTLAGQELGARLDKDGRRRSPTELLAILDEYSRELADQAHRQPLNEIVSRARAQKIYQYTRAVVLMHVATHGMHHRAQCLNMLRHLGVNPLPPSSVVEWSWTTA